MDLGGALSDCIAVWQRYNSAQATVTLAHVYCPAVAATSLSRRIAGARPVDVAVGGAGSPAKQPHADLLYTAAPGPVAWGQLPYADVVFLVAAPRAALTKDKLVLSGVHSTQHFVTADLGTGGIATGAPA